MNNSIARGILLIVMLALSHTIDTWRSRRAASRSALTATKFRFAPRK